MNDLGEIGVGGFKTSHNWPTSCDFKSAAVAAYTLSRILGLSDVNSARNYMPKRVPGDNFLVFFYIFLYIFSHCVLGRPPDHLFIDFGFIVDWILEYFSMFFPRC